MCCQISLTSSSVTQSPSFFRFYHIQEFKLNPEAKIFSPSYTKRLSPTPVVMPDVGNISYIPSNTPMLPVPQVVYSEVGNNPYIPQASPPSKFVPYGNLTAGNAVGGFQFPQPVSIIFPILSLPLEGDLSASS